MGRDRGKISRRIEVQERQGSILCQKEGRYLDSNYQYYARTDKPFVTRGAYGYAHGGFTPQECIIPVFVGDYL